MAKIDDYLIAKGHAKNLREFAQSCRSGDCDKFGAVVKLTETYKGYYGSSSCGEWPPAVVTAVTAEIVASLREFADRAAVVAERAADKARRDAEGEAKEILQGLAQ